MQHFSALAGWISTKLAGDAQFHLVNMPSTPAPGDQRPSAARFLPVAGRREPAC